MNSTIHCPIPHLSNFEADPVDNLTPLIDHLCANIPVTEPLQFPKGTVLPDGRLDLCKQRLGAAGCRLITEALTKNTTIVSLLLGTNGIGNEGAADVARLIEQNSHLEIIYLGCNQKSV